MSENTLAQAISTADETAYQLLKQLNQVKELSGDSLVGDLIKQIIDTDVSLAQQLVASLNRLNQSIKKP